MEDDDDFTFPTTIAAPAPPEVRRLRPDDEPAALPASRLGKLRQLPPSDTAAAPPPPPTAASSHLWPFAASAPPPMATAAATTVKEEAAPAPGRGEAEEEHDAAADEERMDLLWEGDATAATTTPPASSRSAGAARAEPPLPEREGAAGRYEELRRASEAPGGYDDKMDLLWESFNEELLLRRARSKAAAADRPAAARLVDPPDWYLCQLSPSDAESEETSSAASPRYAGCAPTMLRASSRAGGAGHFCGGSSPHGRVGRGRGRSRGAAAGWALLLRLFRRLFAVDKTAPTSTSTRRHSTIYVP